MLSALPQRCLILAAPLAELAVVRHHNQVLMREMPRLRRTTQLVTFMNDHQGKPWEAHKWTRQPDAFLARVHDRIRAQRQGGMIFVPCMHTQLGVVHLRVAKYPRKRILDDNR